MDKEALEKMMKAFREAAVSEHTEFFKLFKDFTADRVKKDIDDLQCMIKEATVKIDALNIFLKEHILK